MEDGDDKLTKVIEAQVNEWSSSSVDSFHVHLVRGDGSVVASFQPEFTYAMFGQEESIFGYQNLEINLSFRTHDLAPKLDIKYGKIFPAQKGVETTDIKKALADFLPSSAFKDRPLDDRNTTFRPPGAKIHEYERGGNKYETWCASLADPAARKIMDNMQIFVPMFIDGGSTLELEQDWTAQRWKIFLVYEVDDSASGNVSPYILAGFGTSYRTFTFPERQKAVQWDVFSPSSQTLLDFLPSPDGKTNKLAQPADFISPLDLPARERLSQFLMLPPWHGSGHGQELYSTMFKHLTAAQNVREFTVEDPNEKFDELRDFCDLVYLRANVPEFAQLRVHTDVPQEKMGLNSHIPTELIVPLDARKSVMKSYKFMPRQFDRLVEMHTLSFIPERHRSRNRITRKGKSSDENDRAYYFWRLYAKHRLYIFNRDQLAQVEHEERVVKLESALDSVIEQYSETIEKVEKREHDIANGELDAASADNPVATKRKRPVISDDDDEESELGAEQDCATDPNGQKKARVE